jgi:hypothetical protein
MSDEMKKLIAAAAQTSGATSDMIEAVSDGEIKSISNVGSGDTLVILVDGMRLLVEAMTDSSLNDGFEEDTNQLYGALVRFLEAQS